MDARSFLRIYWIQPWSPYPVALNVERNAAKKADPLESHMDELRERLPPDAVIIGGAGRQPPSRRPATSWNTPALQGRHHPERGAPSVAGNTGKVRRCAARRSGQANPKGQVIGQCC